MRFKRADPGDADDVIIDLRERLAPYGEDELQPVSSLADATVAPEPARRSRRAKAPAPRHLAR